MTTEDRPPAGQPAEPNSDSRPVLKLIKGNATEEELAALVTVVAAMSAGGSQETGTRPAAAWSGHPRKVRVTLRHGRGGWRASGLPR